MGRLWTDFKILTGFCFLLQTTVDFATGESCQYVAPCSCQTNDFVLNLKPLMDARKGTPFQVVGSDTYTYYVNPCNTALTTVPKCMALDPQLVACQVTNDGANAYGLGKVGTNGVTGDPEKGTVKFTNSYTDPQGLKRIMEMAVKCSDKEADFTFTASRQGPEGVTYPFTLSTHYACPPSSSSGGLSAGSVLVILFFVFIIVYLVGGVLFLKVVKKAEGREAIPNYEFWKDLPSLVKDGVLFTCRGCKAESTYEKI